jgi:hypothetical protein
MQRARSKNRDCENTRHLFLKIEIEKTPCFFIKALSSGGDEWRFFYWDSKKIHKHGFMLIDSRGPW